jgi:hypothetical protein
VIFRIIATSPSNVTVGDGRPVYYQQLVLAAVRRSAPGSSY